MKRITLIHPPLDDPTIPYHSTAYLKGHLQQNGFTDVSLRDLNVEFVNYCLEEDVSRSFFEEGERRLSSFNRRERLSFSDQEQFHGLLCSRRPDLTKVVRGLRNMDAFLDYATYIRNVRELNGYFGFLGSLSYPMEFENLVPRSKGRFSFYAFSDLLNSDLATRVSYPMERFFEERLRHDASLAGAQLLGISVVYDHQIMYALHLARLCKRAWPGTPIVLGGTAMSQVYKYLKDKQQLQRLFDLCDAIVVGEGETAICEIGAFDRPLEEAQGLYNVVTYDRIHRTVRLPEIRYENVAALGRPIYDHPWDLYLSPARGINYSPTRGCYWNRCTFCDYGLNTEKPTSPWRERKIDQVISDIRSAQAEHGVKYVYFAVDVMAPGYLERLSDAIIATGLDIRWSGEIRMEKIFHPDRCRKLSRSGCVSVAFGMESGNQRILDLIDKGTKIGTMGQTMKNFAQAGIAVQIMAFKEFPTETEDEQRETIRFLRDHSDFWSAGGIGKFLLTGTAIVAKDPSKFGITLIDTDGADIARAVAYTTDSRASLSASLTEDADSSFDEAGSIFPVTLGRPWAGGTDSFHTMIYYEHHGQFFFKTHPLDSMFTGDPRSNSDFAQRIIRLDSKLAMSSIDLTPLAENRADFKTYIERQRAMPAEPTYERFTAWQRNVKSAEPGVRGYWLLMRQKAVQLPRPIYNLLQLAQEHELPVGKAIKGLSPEIQAEIIARLRELEKRGFLRLEAGAGVS